MQEALKVKIFKEYFIKSYLTYFVSCSHYIYPMLLKIKLYLEIISINVYANNKLPTLNIQEELHSRTFKCSCIEDLLITK